MLSISPWLAMALALANAAFLVRLFMIQHDCGHGAFFKNRRVGDWMGRFIGVLSLTPYDIWRKTHSIHHATTGNLDKRTGETVRDIRFELHAEVGSTLIVATHDERLARRSGHLNFSSYSSFL